jgi:hypothetical protein
MTKKAALVFSCCAKGAFWRNSLTQQTDMWRETWNVRFLRREPWYRQTNRALLKRIVARAALGVTLLIVVEVLRLSMR